jgi:hypothetical protein
MRPGITIAILGSAQQTSAQPEVRFDIVLARDTPDFSWQYVQG